MISIIIPTYNEGAHITELLQSIFEYAASEPIEIIVSDAGSTDHSLQKAAKTGAIAVLSPVKGRAAQMNYGASLAKGEILYFVHADTRLHKNFAKDIPQSVADGYQIGCYRLKLDSKNPLFKINTFFTRLPYIWCRGGDQTLFITRPAFDALGGFQNMAIMEEYALIKKAKELQFRFKIIPENVVASARKYEANGYFRVLRANYIIMKLWKSGKATDKEMAALYKQLINHR